MKFLFDQSADFRLIPHLRELGHDVSAIARDEQRILMVADRDFGELIFQQGLAHAGLIFFRLPGPAGAFEQKRAVSGAPLDLKP